MLKISIQSGTPINSKTPSFGLLVPTHFWQYWGWFVEFTTLTFYIQQMLTAATSWMREKHMTIWIKAVSIHLHMYTIYAIEVSIPYIYMYIYTFLGISICILYTIQSIYIYRGFLKWGYPKMYGLWWKNRSVHGWFKGTPISGNFNICTCIYIYDLQMYIFTICTYTIYTLACVFCYSMGISVLRDP